MAAIGEKCCGEQGADPFNDAAEEDQHVSVLDGVGVTHAARLKLSAAIVPSSDFVSTHSLHVVLRA